MYNKVKNALHLKPMLYWYIYCHVLLICLVAPRYNGSPGTDTEDDSRFLMSHSHLQAAQESLKRGSLQQHRAAVQRSYSRTQ